MTDEARRVLELLARRKITVDEAQQLLRALERPGTDGPEAPPPVNPARHAPRWVKIVVDKPGRDGREPKQVAIKIPIAFVRGGAKFGSMFARMEPISRRLREQGIDVDFSSLDSAQIEKLLSHLGETTIDVDEGRGTAKVRITCE